MNEFSDRNATFILASGAKSLGHCTANIVLNKESIRQARRKHQESLAIELKDLFAPDTALTIHWDYKMLPALMSKESVDRLAVLVSGDGIVKFLGFPQLPNGTGEAQAKAVFHLLQE